MTDRQNPIMRRRFLQHSMGMAALSSWRADETNVPVSEVRVDHLQGKALIAISLDLEMSRNFPKWEDTSWDFEKGNLDLATKQYSVEAAKRVKASGGRIHFFALGQTLEQENVDWLLQLIQEGHSVGNHTYDHVNVLASAPEQVQFRFQRSPWLMGGKAPQEVIVDNIRLADTAIRSRLGIAPNGFRTPGGFAKGMKERPDLQKLFLDLGYSWISSLYPPHPNGTPREMPSVETLDAIVAAQPAAQPFAYSNGLIEVPMSPISDIGAFRTGRWPLEGFLQAIERSVLWAIEQRQVFDFLSHPSCLVAMDPQFRAVELICGLVQKHAENAALVDLSQIAAVTRLQNKVSVR